MENRICRLFLRLVCTASIFAFSQVTIAAEEGGDADLEVRESSPLIEPYIMRLDLDEDEIDNENFEIGVYYGKLNMEDFGTNDTYALTAAFHVTEDFFVELIYGVSELQQPVNKGFLGGGQTFTSDELDMAYYNLSLGFHVLPGESFVWRDWAFNSQLYLIGGIGTTEYVLDLKETTFNIGAGYRLILTDWLALRFDVRDHIFKRSDKVSNALGETSTGEIMHNLEVRGGISIFF